MSIGGHHLRQRLSVDGAGARGKNHGVSPWLPSVRVLTLPTSFAQFLGHVIREAGRVQHPWPIAVVREAGGG